MSGKNLLNLLFFFFFLVIQVMTSSLVRGFIFVILVTELLGIRFWFYKCHLRERKESPKTRLLDLRDEKDQIWRREAAKLKQPSGEKKE